MRTHAPSHSAPTSAGRREFRKTAYTWAESLCPARRRRQRRRRGHESARARAARGGHPLRDVDGMMAVHELGHMLSAWLSGGRVVQLRLPPLGFSQTIVHPNPHEALEIWGGPVGGVLLPLVA